MCALNQVNSINAKSRPPDQATTCRNARIRDAASGVIGGRRFQWNLNLSIFATRTQASGSGALRACRLVGWLGGERAERCGRVVGWLVGGWVGGFCGVGF